MFQLTKLTTWLGAALGERKDTVGEMEPQGGFEDSIALTKGLWQELTNLKTAGFVILSCMPYS